MKKLITVILCFALIACIPTKHFAPQNQYLLNIQAPQQTTIHANKQPIFVEQITETAPFDQLNFVYLTKNGQYISDCYNAFLTPAAQQIYPALVAYLKSSSKYKPITMTTGNPPTVSLQSELTSLYADYSDSRHPKAVVTMHFVIAGKLDKTYSAAEPLAEKTTASLITGWNKGIQKILDDFIQQRA